jgi:hypothetical protein
MAKSVDWLQRNHESLYNQAKATVGHLTDQVLNRVGITGPILAWYNGEFIPKNNAFNLAFEDWLNPADRTPAKTATLKTAENEFKPVYRKLYTGYLKNNPLVTDTDLVEMGLPKRFSGVKTPPTPPTSVIEATVDTSVPATLIVHYRDKNDRGTAKPKNVRGTELKWIILDIPPTDWAQLLNSEFDTRTPIKLVFSGNQRGKTVYFALRWENNVGDKGPWSEIYSAIIP